MAESKNHCFGVHMRPPPGRKPPIVWAEISEGNFLSVGFRGGSHLASFPGSSVTTLFEPVLVFFFAFRDN